MCFFFFKQKTAYEIVSRDWSSEVCSSDLLIDNKCALLTHELSRNLEKSVLSVHLMSEFISSDRKSVV